MRLIDADALIEDIKSFWDWDSIDGITATTVLKQTMTDISNAPTIDAEPVRHGRWIVEDNPGTGWYLVECSECGENVTSTAPCIGFPPDAEVTWDYCPYCGAKMDEAEP